MHKILSRLWSVATRLPVLFLGLILAAQTLFALKSRALWFSDEVRYANVFEHLIQAQKWLVMYLNGVPYPDKPPVYFWFLAALKPLFPSHEPALFFLGAALSAFILVVCTVVLARKVFQADRDTTLGAGLILLTCFYFIGLSHYSRMDLLFASFITLSQTCLYIAWNRDKARFWLCSGFILAALAVLTKGPLGLAFPIVTSLVYLAWTGRLKRFFRKDVALGAGICLVILMAWVAGAYIAGEHEYLGNIFYKQIYKRAVNAPHHLQPFYHYALTLPLAWMPWTLVLFALPMRNLLLPDFWRNIWRTRQNPNQGTAYLWIMVISGFALLSVVSIKIIVYLLPLFPPLAVLTAHSLANLSERASNRLFLMIGILFLVLGANAPFVNFMHPW
ncbi:MAG: glycosyltransferase family 39 protein, partial [Thermodesulfobacteriota bacterium]|nr:glycosyltransferase family 39 protein [Thermodesulfobacteriota bacterium]